MLKVFFEKFKESVISVLPVTLLVVILNFTPIISLTAREIIVFLGSSVMLIVGMAFFNLGADIAMTPMGDHFVAGLSY